MTNQYANSGLLFCFFSGEERGGAAFDPWEETAADLSKLLLTDYFTSDIPKT